MKLTKEESLIALYRLTYLANCNSNVNEIVWSQILKEVNELDQLIDEHFESSLTREKLEDEIELLKRENKALADDNYQKCELNEKLSKEINKLKRMLKTFK